ncbi:hypothetical protein [Levilactobacillus lindianensis]|uniref:hypothetical protein n=1 Tax=Levilactobacillus lindianensis TaxID=2486018 RepID=UPI001CDC2DBB|nr:hypothetical protein [Levilactobacillus lindianensis]
MKLLILASLGLIILCGTLVTVARRHTAYRRHLPGVIGAMVVLAFVLVSLLMIHN